MICDVIFDLPRQQPFSYSVPPEMALERGQRVSAPLHGRSRIGVVVDLREADSTGLKAIERAAESVPIVSGTGLELSRWAAEQSLSSWGSTLLALLPPLAGRRADLVSPAAEAFRGPAPPAELWIGESREARLVDRLASEPGSALVIAPDREGAALWAARLDDAPRLDSGAPKAARRVAWFAAARGRSRIVVGTRSALLTPLPPPATLVLIDEHHPSHKPPGPPRIHSREILRQRAHLEGSRLVLLSATPSVESWWRAENAGTIRDAPDESTWPEVVTGDTRGILRNHPLTLPLTRAIEDTTRRGRRVALIVTRRAASLLCRECGSLLRCADCGVPLGFSRGARGLGCRLCARVEPLPERCPRCRGHRLSPSGWDPERVEAAVSRRFPKRTVSRTDPRAEILVGTPALMRRLSPGTLGCVGIVALDSLLGMPDFRGGERAFELVWAAAEAVRPRGRVVVQTHHPGHYAIQAVKDRDRRRFYKHELQLRADLGYPPFRRLCVVTARGLRASEVRARIAECAVAVGGIGGLTVYPAAPAAAGAGNRWQFAIKGPDDLPRLLGPVLSRFLEHGRRSGAMLDVEMDPV